MPLEYAEFCLCREMGWDYNQLDEQPAWRVQQAFAFLSAEGREAERKRKMAQQKARRGGRV